MSLASFSLQPSYITFARSATFPKSGLCVARKRVQQVAGHLVRSNTIATTIKGGARNNTSTATNIATENHNTINMASKKDTTGSKCQTCKGTGNVGSSVKPSGAVDIDQKVEDIYHQLPALPSPLPKPHRDFVHCKPPGAPTYRKFSVFTAGSIEMGKAVQWQSQMATMLSPLPITVNNPRRGNWDPTVTPEAKDAAFRQQVEWELSALEQADVICFFFDVNTMSPVTLLELGIWAASDKVVVCCDPRYWRSGNVHIVCDRYGIPVVDTFAELVPAIEKMLVEKGMQLDQNGDLVGENKHIEKPRPKKKSVLEAEVSDLHRQIAALQAQLGKSKV
ncbi:hypothetical protein T440DRAFT_464819 [Plenodomus tracheiphilus IPT5]|uniref:Uncharacterized protein n=1 Tax=Plenodomus tracheiphilus IPT5 TaxID=1408161 RepID=A0A6A7BIT3_9PLEO|nr:hypothetical protein T440DRAFT_464819 [Plenodomus tracheiphilus IPT5]